MEFFGVFEQRKITALKRTLVLTAMATVMFGSLLAIDLYGGCWKMNLIIIFSTGVVFAALESIYWKKTLRFKRAVKITLLGYSIGLVFLSDLITKQFLTDGCIDRLYFGSAICTLCLQFLPTYIGFYKYQY